MWEKSLSATEVVLSLNGAPVQAGRGDAVLGNPPKGLQWVANQLGTLGQTLEAGSVVIAGSITAAIAIAPGDTATAEFVGIETLEVSFS